MSTSRVKTNKTSKAKGTATTSPKKSHNKHKCGSSGKSGASEKLVSNDFKNEEDCSYVTKKDLNKAVNEILSQNTIEVALERNANLFAESILHLQERVIMVEAKLESLEDRMEEVEEIVYIRHQRHIEKVVRKIMEEFPECPEQMTEVEARDHTTDFNNKQQFDGSNKKASEQGKFPVVAKGDRFCNLESQKICACTPNNKNDGTKQKKLSRSRTTMTPKMPTVTSKDTENKK